MVEAYPSPGEINCKLENPKAAIQRVREHFEGTAVAMDTTDGISMEFPDWRFNLRMSNTEPVVRLNIETRCNRELLELRQTEILSLLDHV